MEFDVLLMAEDMLMNKTQNEIDRILFQLHTLTRRLKHKTDATTPRNS